MLASPKKEGKKPHCYVFFCPDLQPISSKHTLNTIQHTDKMVANAYNQQVGDLRGCGRQRGKNDIKAS